MSVRVETTHFRVIVNALPDHIQRIVKSCPRLIPVKSARQSRNLLRAGQRNSTNCSPQKMSSLNCGKSAPRIAPLPNCSPAIACQLARRPSPCSVTKSLAKSHALAGDRLVMNRPSWKPQFMKWRSPLYRHRLKLSHPQNPTAVKLRQFARVARVSRKSVCLNLNRMAHETS